ncbi:MAG: RsmB/NOP family class I SAM-dependent RNA methyltransferase [Myxococcaceae bacterium]
MPRPPPSSRRGPSRPTSPRPSTRSAAPDGTRQARSEARRRRRREEESGARPERPVREDLVTQASLEAYGAIRHEGRLADRALEYTLRPKRHLYSNERRAVAERVYALVRRQRTVDALLERTGPAFGRLATTAQDRLRIASSRVLDGEPTPDVARGMGLSLEELGLLEALPAAGRSLARLPEEERFALEVSFPDALAKAWRAEYREEARRAAEAVNARAPLTIRTNTLKTDREALRARLRTEGVEATPTPLSPLGLFLTGHQNAFSLNSFREGLFEIQDEGSQLLGLLVDAPPTRVVDACAGAGGKTLQLAAQMKNRGELFALDIDARRLEDLRQRARRAGVHNTRVRLIPSEGPAAREALRDLEASTDRVLVDAPCTGTGTLRRKPDARYRFTDQALAEAAARQRALLEQFAPLVKPGGRLVYGTCSVLRAENEAVVEDFLAAHPEFRLLPPADKLGPELGANVSRGDYLRLTTHVHGTDGFFGATLLRQKPPPARSAPPSP